MTKCMSRIVLPALAGLMIASCGPLVELPGSGPAPDFYNLSRVTAPGDLGVSAPVGIMVEEPAAAPELMQNRIAIALSGTQIKYYAGARWSDRPSRLLRDRLVEAMESVPGVYALARDVVDVPADYKLALRLRELNAAQRAEGGAPEAHFRLSAMLLDARNGQVVAQKQLDYQKPAAADSPEAVVDALDDLAHRGLSELISWVIQTVGPHRAA